MPLAGDSFGQTTDRVSMPLDTIDKERWESRQPGIMKTDRTQRWAFDGRAHIRLNFRCLFALINDTDNPLLNSKLVWCEFQLMRCAFPPRTPRPQMSA